MRTFYDPRRRNHAAINRACSQIKYVRVQTCLAYKEKAEKEAGVMIIRV